MMILPRQARDKHRKTPKKPVLSKPVDGSSGVRRINITGDCDGAPGCLPGGGGGGGGAKDPTCGLVPEVKNGI
jgi:hypothetical protein